MNEFLERSEVVDWDHPAVLAQARELAGKSATETAQWCFEWVRDEIEHSVDNERNPVTWRASDVLAHRTGFCFAKSHLLAALLRASGIAAGFCYQRLSFDGVGPPYTLHGFNAIDLPGHGWYRVDARGNRAGIEADFTPPVERLAFATTSDEEAEFANVFAEPLEMVVESLRSSRTWEDAVATLPDVAPAEFAGLGLTRR